MKLAVQLLDDSHSGLITDADGRRWFRPRRVAFRTIAVDAAELLEAGWLGFEQALPPLNWEEDPSHDAVRDFARALSERHIEFWYRVMDVALARAMSGRDRQIFERPFFRPSCHLDIGVPQDQAQSSVPPRLHAMIVKEYRNSLQSDEPGIYYLSDYLTGLSDDVQEQLRPYRTLWRLRRARERLLALLGRLSGRLVPDSLGTGPTSAGSRIRAAIAARLSTSLCLAAENHREREIESAMLRDMIHRTRRGWRGPYSDEEIAEALDHRALLRVTGRPHLLFTLLRLPDLFAATARSAAMLESAAQRLELQEGRTARLQRHDSGAQPREGVKNRIRAYRARHEDRLSLLRLHLPFRGAVDGGGPPPALTQDSAGLSPAILWGALGLVAQACAQSGDAAATALAALENGAPEVVAGKEESFLSGEKTRRTILSVLGHLGRVGAQLVELHASRDFAPRTAGAGAPDKAQAELTDEPDAGDRALPSEQDRRYPGCSALHLPADLVAGDPSGEREVVARARTLLLHRLRPIRQSAGIYTLVPEHRHGALPLNPIMKLWKDRPTSQVRDDPAIIALQFNTKSTVRCLLDLALLADPHLAGRQLARGRIARMSRGTENVATLRTFLLPGSCYPLREVNRADFPEFRGRVIGESRSPIELGIPSREMSILTGGWYRKRHHCLYYPVGGDNANLLSIIWRSARASGPPAFFFGLGQFVHDCLPDELIFYKAGTRTFRECVEDYFRTEDRLRRDRGERSWRRRLDNSRHGVRFMFAVAYSRAILEILTGSSQIQFRHTMTERWLVEHLGLPVLNMAERSELRRVRRATRECIEGASARIS